MCEPGFACHLRGARAGGGRGEGTATVQTEVLSGDDFLVRMGRQIKKHVVLHSETGSTDGKNKCHYPKTGKAFFYHVCREQPDPLERNTTKLRLNLFEKAFPLRHLFIP